MDLDWLLPRTILLVQTGSHAYGLNTKDSDRDSKGITVPPREYFTGFLRRFEQYENKETDCTIYDLRKFCFLGMSANPSIIEVLWVPDHHVLYVSPAGKKLIDNRSLFLSRKVRHSFTGYAYSQLNRIKRHKGWILHPPNQPPTRADFGLVGPGMSRDQVGAITAVLEAGGYYPPGVIEVYTKEMTYKRACKEWEQYQGWLKNRNPARAELEAKYGYDCKHAMHLVRLMRMGLEILQTGFVQVLRQDREELLAIRNGAWTYERVIEYAEQMEKDIALAEAHSELPWGADSEKIDTLCREIVDSMI